MYGKIQVYLDYHPPGYYGRILTLGHIEKNIYKASSKCHIARKVITLVKVASYRVDSNLSKSLPLWILRDQIWRGGVKLNIFWIIHRTLYVKIILLICKHLTYDLPGFCKAHYERYELLHKTNPLQRDYLLNKKYMEREKSKTVLFIRLFYCISQILCIWLHKGDYIMTIMLR